MTLSLKPEAQRTAERAARELADRRDRRREAADEASRTRVADFRGDYQNARIKPTRQTVQKLEPDPLTTLHDRGSISDAQRDAALEIRQAYTEVAGLAMMRSLRYDGALTQPGSAFATAQEHATHAQIQRRQVYAAWAKRCAPDAVSVTIDVVVDAHSLRQVDAERRWRSGTASAVLVGALALYARLAGSEGQSNP